MADMLETLRAGVVARVMPWMRDALDAALRDLDTMASANPPSPALVEDRTDIVLLLRDVLAYERRWQERIDAMLKGWPALPRTGGGGFELMAEGELQVQLVGAPVIDALERRFEDAIDPLDRRLYSLAARMGTHERPRNPFAPRALAESFLRSFSILDSSARVHALVLRHFSRLASDRLGAVYQWCNTTLADAGYELSSGNEGVLIAGLTPEMAAPRAPGAARSHASPAATGGDPTDALRTHLMRLHKAPDMGAVRQMRQEELSAIVSLLQVEREPSIPIGAETRTAEALRMRIEHAGAGIGIARDGVARTAAQDAHIEAVGLLLDGLRASSTLSPASERLLKRMALPLLRIAFDTPDLFDDLDHPLLRLLGNAVSSWDGNVQRTQVERDLHRIADQAVAEFLADPHGDARLAARLLDGMEAEAGPLRRRAEIASKRLWQSVQGKERLEAARHEADLRLQRLHEAGPLPPILAGFLSEHWRQWLVQTWLRDGRESQAYDEAVAVGDRMLALDAETDGRRLAQSLIELEPLLRKGIATSGLQGDAAVATLSAVVAEYADPDRLRAAQVLQPLATEPPDEPDVAVDDPVGWIEVGDRIVYRHDDGATQPLQVAWRSPLSGRTLLVDALGAREAMPTPAEVRQGLADGRFVHRRGADPVAAVLQAFAEAQASGDGRG